MIGPIFHYQDNGNEAFWGRLITENISIDKVNLLQMDKLNNSVDVLQKPTLIGTLNGTSLKYLMYLFNVCHI